MLKLSSNNYQSSNHFEAFFEYATMGILVSDVNGRITAINPFALKEFGYSKEELIGREIEILIPQRFCNKHIHHRKKYDVKQQIRPMGIGMDLFGIRKDGAEFPVEVSLGHYTSNGGNYVVAFITNISVRKAAEAEIEKLHIELENTVTHRTKALQETMHQLEKSRDILENVLSFQKALLDTAGAMIIATDENGIINLFNPEAVLNLQYSEEEIINLETPVLFHDKKELERERKILQKELGITFKNSFEVWIAKARRNIREERQCNYVRKDGSSFPVLLTTTTLRDARKNIIGYMKIAIDISERIKAEKELKKVQQLFLQLLENYPDGTISIIDKDYNFAFTGGKLHQRLKADVGAMIGSKMYPNFPDSLRKIIFQMLEKILPLIDSPFGIIRGSNSAFLSRGIFSTTSPTFSVLMVFEKEPLRLLPLL